MAGTEHIPASAYRAMVGGSGPALTAPVRESVQAEARGTLKPRGMNGLEAEYAAYLDTLKLAGEVLWWEFEGVKFRLGDDCWYRPDFLVMLASGCLEAHETKGFWRDDARVKIKVAADTFPIPFIGIRKSSAGWDREVFS